MTNSSAHTCDHCGLRFSRAAKEAVCDDKRELAFCCIGCQAVYHTLHEAGLEDFYALRESWSEEAQPVDPERLQADQATLFDSPQFLQDHSEVLADGTRRIELHIEGVHCGGCIWLIERMPRLLEGVVDARQELARRRLTVHWDPQRVQLSEIARWLSQFGFQAHGIDAKNVEQRSQSSKKMLTRVGICWAVAANVMLLTIALYAGLDAQSDPGLYTGILWTTFGLAAVSLYVGGSVFFRRAWTSLKAGRLSMDAPISLGILAGFGHSGWATITGHGAIWFDSIVILTAALLTARYLQIRGNSLAADAAERLVALLPRTARRVLSSGPGLPKESGAQELGSVEVVPAETLVVGDRIEVRAGDVVPADGCVVIGKSEVSRAVLTGESRPEKIAPGGILEAGTTNLTSPIYLDVTATGASTRVGQLMEWVRSGAKDRAPVVQFADRLGSYFISFVLLAALVTAVAWSFVDPTRAVANVIALLVIACPCALGMATPLALTVGVGRAARRGIHIKNDDVIEALAAVTDVVFDKTGTLTEGRPSVVDSYGDQAFARRACALETRSSHPVGRALLKWAGPGISEAEVEEVEETPGAGIRGLVDGSDVSIGRLSWFDDVSSERSNWAEEQARRGLTPVAFAVGGEIRALVAVGDGIRPESKGVIERLRRRGIRVHLLSGDHPRVVEETGRALSIDEGLTTGGVSPEEKLRYIEALEREHPLANVAMIGDGVNDAAALQAATVGVAVHGGAEASLVAADVFIVRNGVAPVEELLQGSQKIMSVVHRNLKGSGVYNLLGITLAGFGFITPLLAAVLMPISSLGVVASSLIQSSFEPDRPEELPEKAPIARHSTTEPAMEPAP